jgi:hypothetical protein
MFQMFHLFFVAASVLMLQVASVLSGCCICFHTYVVSVFSRGFICRRMLHLSVSCCTCFMLFGELGARRKARTSRNGARRAEGWRSGVRWGEANGWGQVESRRTGRIASKSYGHNDAAMRMRAGRISGRWVDTVLKWSSDRILSCRMSRRQHVPR